MKKFFHYLSAFFGEGFALLRVALYYPFFDDKIDPDRPGVAVLCIHGLYHNGSAWGPLKHYLQNGGVGPVDTINYPSVVLDIPQSSQRIQERILQIKKETGRNIDTLIGHSEGGLVALEYALELAPKDRITTVITLGAPLQGTHLAKLGIGPGAKQMRLNSEYLKKLRERMQAASHVRLYAIGSYVDGVIRPPSAAFWPEYPHDAFNNLGHVGLIFSKRVAGAILNYIRSTG